MKSDLVVLTPLKAIRAKCLDCSGESAMEVRECTVKQRALFAYRIAKRPNTMAKREAQRAAA